jgi:rhamnose transport system permease protein
LLNGLLVTQRGIPPLIVTLATFSVFRGMAEGLTAGGRSFGSFDESFLFLGRGSVAGVPAQVWILLPAAVAWWLLVHRSVIGRTWSAIGFSPEGSRYAGLPVQRRTATAYVLAGVSAGVAALVYAADNGQAKADAGVGYELAAITAVVLGGTSIFGGRASVAGTVLGLLAVAVLENGQTMAGFPRELGGVLSGVLLLVAATLDYVWTRARSRRTPPAATLDSQGNPEDLDMRNSQLAVLCGVIMAAALIVVGGNLMVARTIRDALAESRPAGAKKLTVAVMPKSKGNAYFVACGKGAKAAAQELGVEMLWDAPTESNAEKQKQIIDRWITRKVDAISVAVEDAGVLSDSLAKARAAGIKVVTWDADAREDARDFFCNQATPEAIGDTLLETAAQEMGGEGEFVIISGTQTAANLTQWRLRIESQLKRFPKLKLLETQYCDDLQNRATQIGKEMITKHQNLKLIMAICSPAVPGAAEAVKQSGKPSVKVIGLGLPNENKKYVHEGVTQAVILWKTEDLGYLAVHAAKAAAEGTLKPGDTEFDAGRLNTMKIEGSSIILGKPFVFRKDNIDQFDF